MMSVKESIPDECQELQEEWFAQAALEYEEVRQREDVLTEENKALNERIKELKEQIFGIHDDEMDANGLFDDIKKLKEEIKEAVNVVRIMSKAEELNLDLQIKQNEEIKELKEEKIALDHSWGIHSDDLKEENKALNEENKKLKEENEKLKKCQFNPVFHDQLLKTIS